MQIIRDSYNQTILQNLDNTKTNSLISSKKERSFQKKDTKQKLNNQKFTHQDMI